MTRNPLAHAVRFLLVAAITLPACGREPAPAGMRVGLITPGSIADAAWNSGAYRGLELIRDSVGAAVSHVEARTPAEQEQALRTYASEGYDLVIAHGHEFQRMAEAVTADHPKTVIVVTSGERAVGSVAPIVFRLHEATYLAGILAGGLTRSGKLGFIGGVEIPPVKLAYEGWAAGARSVNPAIDSRFTYLNNWDDAAAGREAALALIALGVDVFHHNADAAALGLFQVAKERPGILVFGANQDQSALAPDAVPGSAVIDLPRAFLSVAREVKAGTFTPRVLDLGLASGVVRFDVNPAFANRLDPALLARMQAASDSITRAAP